MNKEMRRWKGREKRLRKGGKDDSEEGRRRERPLC